MLAGVFGEESLLAFGTRPLALFIDPDLFPPATLNVPGFLLIEGPVDSDDIIYGDFITLGAPSLFPPLFTDVDVIYAFSKGTSLALAPALFVDADVLYSPRITGRVLGPSLFIDDDIFGGVKRLQQGKASINQSTTVDPVFDFDIFYSPVVGFPERAIIRRQYAIPASAAFESVTPPTSIIPGRGVVIAETGVPGAAPLGYLSPNLFNPGDVIFGATAFGGLQPSLVADNDVFYSPSPGNILQPTAFVDADNVLAARAGTQLRPSATADLDIFFGPALGTPGRMGLIIDDDIIYASVIARAPLGPALFAADDSFFTPVIGAQALLPNDPIVDFIDTFYVPTAIINQQLVPHLWVEVDDIKSIPSVAIGQGAQPGIVLDGDTVPATSVVVGAAAILPGLLSDTDAFYMPSISGAAYARALGAARAGLGAVIVTESSKTQNISNVGVVK